MIFEEDEYMENIIKLVNMISEFTSPWQILGLAVILAFVFGCLWSII